MVIKRPANQITPWLHALITNHTHIYHARTDSILVESEPM